ncbi:DNA ligase 1-like [Mercenaria mercenaria]|uniref:DNA ligase 1-like n=1 Tax=Mercenaria mercenaria TaxID=6596 RepID=UPI00234F1242|nr:DNA ligase 1-like [Mercenaria mercenaria]
MMGKVKKPASASKEEGQKKISSFFQQKPAEKTKPKALFTEHGHQKNAQKFQLTEQIAISDGLEKKLESTGRQNLPNEKENVKETLRCKAEHVETSVNERARAKNTADSAKQAAVTCIPETQICFTPPGVKESKNDVKDSPEVNDFGLIPDTPQEKKEEVTKPKRPLGRSFLLSAAQMGTNPIQKAKEHRQEKLAMKKKVSQARKSLLSVSVQFNPEEKEMSNGTVKTACSLNAYLDKNVTADTENHNGDLHGNSNLVCDGKTPTKIYSDGNTMKRMAKSGTSPDSKRLVSDESGKVNDSNGVSNGKQLSLGNSVCKLDFDGNTEKLVTEGAGLGKIDTPVDETDFKSAKSLLENKSKAKSKEEQIRMERKKMRERMLKLKQEKELLEKKRVAKEENRRKSEKLMKYQLTGVADGEEKYEGDISVTQDDALDDILQELKSPSLIKPSKTSKSSVISKTKIKASDFTKTKPLDKKTTDKIVKRHTHADDTSKTNDSAVVKHKELDIVNDWTKEDDDYFSKLGVEIGVKTKGKDVLKKADDEFEIEHYLTPCNLATERSKTPTAEMEIEEFVSQQPDSKLLCDQMEGLSPFKKKRETTNTVMGQTEAPCASYGRHTVTKVSYSNDKHQMELDVSSQPGDIHRKCILSGFW